MDEVPVVVPNQHDDVPVVPKPVLVKKTNLRKRKILKKKMMIWKSTSRKMTISWMIVYCMFSRGGTLTLCLVGWLLFQDNYSVARWRMHWFRRREKPKDKFYGKLILELGNEVRSSIEKGLAAMEKLVEKLGNTKDKVECKKLKNELKEARGFVFEERPNEAINVPLKDEKSLSSKLQESTRYP
nr:hypothetical protein [Tanacetum cinerariifolium]